MGGCEWVWLWVGVGRARRGVGAVCLQSVWDGVGALLPLGARFSVRGAMRNSRKQQRQLAGA